MIRLVTETGSTNADLLEKLRGGEPLLEGDWLVAKRQSEGRGRSGREWFDAAGNFMGSTTVHLQMGDPVPGTLALVAGLALYEAAAWHMPETAELQLKWPNDLLAGDAKVAGILLEGIGKSIVVGIGVNLVSAPDVAGRKTAAMADIGAAPDRDVFAPDIARSFATELERWRNGGLGPIIRRWEAAAHPAGTRMVVPDSVTGGGQAGQYAGLTDKGALQLRLADGSMRVIQAGEVLLARGDED